VTSNGAALSIAPGSTLGLDCAPVIGVEPGATWVGVAVRTGVELLDAVTVGRRAVCGAVEGPDADQAWIDAIVGRLDDARRRLHDAALAASPGWPGRFRVAVRYVGRPAQWDPAKPKGRPMGREQSWNVAETRALYLALLGLFPAAVKVPVAHAGGLHLATNGGTGRRADYYPAELLGTRPRSWSRADTPSREHEQAAYVIAGLAELRRRAGGEER
jgi:hypothetical protein